MKQLYLVLLTVLSIYSANTQVVHVCANDTIILEIENYDKGIIEWEESIDGQVWKKIPNATGLKYKFYPTIEKYYRSAIKTSECDPLYSQISFVQFPPVADAGTNREIGDTSLILMGNYLKESVGKWTLLSGNGHFEDNTKNNTRFFSKYGETCSLKWTVTNDCGESSDTVSVNFKEIKVNSNFIVVDMTDDIFSDSTEMVNGIFRIAFSDPAIVPRDSVILIGMREDLSFLRKVFSYSKQGNIYIFNTINATLEDIILQGSIGLGDAFNQTYVDNAGNIQGENIQNTFPTRETLKKYAGINTLKQIYFSSENQRNNGSENRDGSDNKLIDLDLSGIKILKGDGLDISFTDGSNFSVTPNFVCDVNYSYPANIENIKFGIDNGNINLTTNIKFDVGTDFTIGKLEEEISLLKSPLSKYLWVVVGGVPVLIIMEANIKMKLEADLGVGFVFEEKHNITRNFKYLIEGDDLENLKFTRQTNSSTSHNSGDIVAKGDFSFEAKIGPEITFKIYDIIGPYANFFIKGKGDMCVNSAGNWDAGINGGFEANLGIRGKKFGVTFLDLKWNIFEKTSALKKEAMPDELELLNGYCQIGRPGEKLPYPITLKVKSKTGRGVPFVAVNLNMTPGNGSVANNTLYTNSSGMVSFDWILGQNPVNEMTIQVLDCDNEDIKNSPLKIQASNGLDGDYACFNTDMEITFFVNNGYVYPSGYGGKLPYTYSTDGVNYSSTLPKFSSVNAGTFTVYLKDAEGCFISRSLKNEVEDECEYSDLTIFTNTVANTVKLIGDGGLPPYRFSVDNITSFSNKSHYVNLSPDAHTFFIKDALNCITSITVDVEASTPALLAVNPKDGEQFVKTKDMIFEWMAAEYAAYQAYDLYLKKEGESYKLLKSSIESKLFAYNTELINGSKYTWKILVKDEYNEVLDEREFVFNTENKNPSNPKTPVLLNPENHATIANIPLTMNWGNQSGNFVYDLYLDDVNASKLIALNLTSFEHSLNSLISGKTYFWKVIAKSPETGKTATSDIFRFVYNEHLPVVTTYEAEDITSTTASFLGSVIEDGGNYVNDKGFCWSLSPYPNIDEDEFISVGVGLGNYGTNISDLIQGSTYYVRAYAINAKGTAYGNEVMFFTEVGLPELYTTDPYDITSNSAKSGGIIISDGGETITARGIVWGTSPDPTLDSNDGYTSNGTGTGEFESNLTGLSANSTYYLRAYATNINGTSYGNELDFTTEGVSGCGPVTFTYNGSSVTYGTVISANNRCWLDRNLGADQVATSSTDAASYGDLFQWGRLDDGHQNRTSPTTTLPSYGDIPGHNNFILYDNHPWYDWRWPQNSNLWQGVNGTNNSCPEGYRLPTDAEWDTERLSWSSTNTAGAFASPLKLPVTGSRDNVSGDIWNMINGRYWSSSITSFFAAYWSGVLYFGNGFAEIDDDKRANGNAVRCIKD